jgi:hypothetical protein
MLLLKRRLTKGTTLPKVTRRDLRVVFLYQKLEKPFRIGENMTEKCKLGHGL